MLAPVFLMINKIIFKSASSKISFSKIILSVYVQVWKKCGRRAHYICVKFLWEYLTRI